MTDQRRVFDREARDRIDATAREIFCRWAFEAGEVNRSPFEAGDVNRSHRARVAYEVAIRLEQIRQDLFEKEQL